MNDRRGQCVKTVEQCGLNVVVLLNVRSVQVGYKSPVARMLPSEPQLLRLLRVGLERVRYPPYLRDELSDGARLPVDNQVVTSSSPSITDWRSA